jgi:hypothetical protein
LGPVVTTAAAGVEVKHLDCLLRDLMARVAWRPRSIANVGRRRPVMFLEDNDDNDVDRVT